MNIRKLALGAALGLGLVAGGVIVAQDPHRNPNLAEAQRMIDQAIGKLDEAQKVNHDDMEGHAERAKDLLGQARGEIRAAAEAADRHHH
jgi:hypothetical protein